METNALKFDYYLLVSRSDIALQVNLLQAFISNCLRLFKLSLPLGSKFPASERRPGDDAAILAVMGLVRLSCQTYSIWRCIIILEFLLSRSKYNYDALLVMIRLQMITGMGTLAMKHYSQLSIKNVQNATMSWILYMRISTVHPLNPYTISNQEPFDLVKGLCEVRDWWTNAARLNRSAIELMLSHGQYHMLLDSIAGNKFSPHNFSLFMVTSELKRVARFSEMPELKDYSEGRGTMSHASDYQRTNLIFAVNVPAHLTDTRDTTAFPDCEAPGQNRFHEYLHNGPIPNVRFN